MKRWSINYVTQRSVTRTVALDLGKANLQVSLLIAAVASRDMQLEAAGAEAMKWEAGYREAYPLLEQCREKVGRLKVWAWVGKGGAVIAVVVVIVRGIAYLARPLP